MKIIAVNVGQPREHVWHGQAVTTGIFKSPVTGLVRVRALNLDGDRQADLSVHGGPEKAIYAYPVEHYPYWHEQLPHTSFSWGNFGENLSTQGLLEDELCIGDTLCIGSAVLTVTQPRLPCYKLALRFDRDDMTKQFFMSGRLGFYFAVAKEGELQAGDQVEFVSRDPNRLSVNDLFHLYFSKSPDLKLLERALQVNALPQSWKDGLKERFGAIRER